MKRIDRHWLKAGLAGFLATALVLLVRGGGGLQALDLWSYDLWLRYQQPRFPPNRDERFLVVLVTDEDLVRLGQDQVTLAILQKLLFRLAELRPRVVGFALETAITLPKGKTLASELMAAQVPVVVGCVPAAPWEPLGALPTLVLRRGVTQTANSQVPTDPEGGVVRRYFLGGMAAAAQTPGCQPNHSLGLAVAAHYLALQGTVPRLGGTGRTLALGKGQWQPLHPHSGPYQRLRVQGWQMLLRPQLATPEQITLWQALHGLQPDQVQGRVVLVGEDLRANGQPQFQTPLGSTHPAIYFHAQAVAQILDQALWGRGGINYLAEPWESLWIAVWGLLGVALLGYGRQVVALGLGGVGLLVGIWSLSTAMWLPLAGPLLVWGLVLAAAPWCGKRRRPLPAPVAVGTTAPHLLSQGGDSGHEWEGVQVGNNNRYLLQRHLGGGGMGDVFLALDQHLRKPVAVKILTRLPTETTQSGQILERFRREIRVTAKINSIHIVQITDSGVIQNQVPFYVMEYLQGQSLGNLIRQEAPLPVGRTVAILLQVCAGLQAAHSQKVVHRDLKPDNIFLIPGSLGEELVKILDFGIARVMQDAEATTELTAVGSFLGTYRYASPEQCDGRARLADERADLYSLGLIAYEMLTATNPFGLRDTSPRQEWLRCHVQMPPIPIQNQPFGERVPTSLARVIMTCLAKKPADRYPDATHLLRALQECTEVFSP